MVREMRGAWRITDDVRARGENGARRRNDASRCQNRSQQEGAQICKAAVRPPPSQLRILPRFPRHARTHLGCHPALPTSIVNLGIAGVFLVL